MANIPSFDAGNMAASLIASQQKVEAAKYGYAEVMYDRLMKQIDDFEKTLKSDEEIGACLASFGREKIIQVQSIGYHNPYLIVFYGTDTENGQEVRLVQHTSQINVLFVAIKLHDLTKKPRRIGFNAEDEEEPKVTK